MRAGRQPNPDEQLLDEVRAVFADQLEPHFTVEEQVLLPALAGQGRADGGASGGRVPAGYPVSQP